jgi:GxxExxY protein
MNEYLHSELTKSIIGCAFAVHNTLGAGFLEKVYENALAMELEGNGHAVKQQQPIKVFYRGVLVGEFVADLLVDDKVVVELKAVAGISPAHEVQLVNYLKASGLEVGLVLNFGSSLTHKRKHVPVRVRA